MRRDWPPPRAVLPTRAASARVPGASVLSAARDHSFDSYTVFGEQRAPQFCKMNQCGQVLKFLGGRKRLTEVEAIAKLKIFEDRSRHRRGDSSSGVFRRYPLLALHKHLSRDRRGEHAKADQNVRRQFFRIVQVLAIRCVSQKARVVFTRIEEATDQVMPHLVRKCGADRSRMMRRVDTDQRQLRRAHLSHVKPQQGEPFRSVELCQFELNSQPVPEARKFFGRNKSHGLFIQMRPHATSRLGDYRANLGTAQCPAQWKSIVVLLEKSNF